MLRNLESDHKKICFLKLLSYYSLWKYDCWKLSFLKTSIQKTNKKSLNKKNQEKKAEGEKVLLFLSYFQPHLCCNLLIRLFPRSLFTDCCVKFVKVILGFPYIDFTSNWNIIKIHKIVNNYPIKVTLNMYLTTQIVFWKVQGYYLYCLEA